MEIATLYCIFAYVGFKELALRRCKPPENITWVLTDVRMMNMEPVHMSKIINMVPDQVKNSIRLGCGNV